MLKKRWQRATCRDLGMESTSCARAARTPVIRHTQGNGSTENKDNNWNEKRARDEREEKRAKKEREEEEQEDPWTVSSLEQNYVPWSELSGREKVKQAALVSLKIILVIGFLYLFICSLDFLSSSFKLLGGKSAGEVFSKSDILVNPVAGLMMGVLVTVLVQSSSTSTSIVISMVGSGILKPKTSVPIVMGANIGTSVTSTIVALGQITSRGDFRRAFAGATVHDMFNWLSVIVFLPLEIATGYLYHLSDAIVKSMHLDETLDVNQDLLKTITKPFTKLIIQVSSSGIKKIATGEGTAKDTTLMKICCDKVKPASCCSDELKEMASSKKLYGAVQNYTSAQRAAVCQEVDQCVMQDYEKDLEELKTCVSKPWETANVTARYDTLNTLQCDTLSGNATETAVCSEGADRGPCTDYSIKWYYDLKQSRCGRFWYGGCGGNRNIFDSEEQCKLECLHVTGPDCCNNLLKSAPFYGDFGRNATSGDQMSLCNSVNATCFTSDVYKACTANTAWTYGREDEGKGQIFNCDSWTKAVGRTCNKKCEFLFRAAHEKEGGPLSDEALGGILLVISLVLLCVCLVCMGPMVKLIKKFINADFPGYCGYFTGYLAILIGAGMTILVQSSSIFTSTLTPLVGMGVITLGRMYPLTLGSNIGTTATGVLAALAQDVDSIPRSLQVALCHLFFNISGIALFYPLPFFRPPIPAAKFLGTTTAKYRWFAIVYLIAMFFLFPLAVFVLSIPGWYVLAIVLIPIAIIVIIIGIIKCLQAKRPECLPEKLQNWKFLPKPLRSLEPYDRRMRKMCFCARFQDETEPASSQMEKGNTNEGFDDIHTTNM